MNKARVSFCFKQVSLVSRVTRHYLSLKLLTCVNGYVKGWCSVIGPNAGTERVTANFDCDKDPSSASWATNSKGQNPISGGIVIEASGVPPGGINLLYSYIDHTSGTRGTDQVNATQNGQLHMMGFSSDVDNGYYPGDKVTVSVSKVRPKW